MSFVLVSDSAAGGLSLVVRRRQIQWRGLLHRAIAWLGRYAAGASGQQPRGSVEKALASSWRCHLVVDCVYRAVLGRYPSVLERADLLHLVARGASFDDLVETLEQNPEGVERCMAPGKQAEGLKGRHESGVVDEGRSRRWRSPHRSPGEQTAPPTQQASGHGGFPAVTESSRGLSKWRNRSQLPHRPPPIVEGTPERIRSILRSDFDADGGSPVSTRLVLLHIMKTGGTSLSDLCSRWARPGRSWLHVHLDDLLLTPRPLLARLEFLGGHIPFEALSIVPGSFVSATVLRDPVERAISHYAELVNSNPRDAELTLDEFVSSEVYDVPSGNYQARQLALSISVADAWVSYSPEARYLAAGGDPDQPFPLQSLFDSTPIFMSDQELFNIARANLDAIDYVGVTDDLYSLASALAGLFDTNLIDVPVLNRAKPFDRKQLTNSVRKRLEIRTAVDRELYDLAAARSATNDD